jgi:hypothetical protein
VKKARRSLAVLGGVLILVLIAAITGVSPANAAGTGSITGTVSPVVGGALNRDSVISVAAYDSSDKRVSTAFVNKATGVYTVNRLDAGAHRLQFSDVYSNYMDEWYNDKATLAEANPVSVSVGAVTSNINAQLVVSGSITGTVSPVGGGALKPGIDMVVYAFDGKGKDAGRGRVDPTTGAYTLVGLGTGTYWLKFTDWRKAYLEEWYNNKYTSATANPVSVTVGATTANIDVQLAEAGSITGTVSPVGGGALIPGSEMVVYVYKDDDSAHPPERVRVDEKTGAYSVRGLTAGTYLLNFGTLNKMSNYVLEWYSDQATRATANPVSVTGGAVTANIDAQLVGRGSITGTVSPVGGGALNPNAQIEVDAYDSESGKPYPPADVNTATGEYTIDKLRTGTYRLRFRDYSGIYMDEWYNDQASYEKANLVSVTVGSTTSNINAQLAAAGSITGTVSPVGGGALADTTITVGAWDSSGAFVNSSIANPTTGVYTLGGLGSGAYQLRFNDLDEVYAEEWYNDKPTLAEANPVSVTIGAATSNINAQLTPISSITGSIGGTVSPVGGGALAGSNIDVDVFDSSGASVSSSSVNPKTGAYRVSGLVGGSYRLRFRDSAKIYLGEWYNDKATFETATPVSVTVGATTSSINAQLSQAGKIMGTISPIGGGGLDAKSYIDVDVYGGDGKSVEGTTVDPFTGEYTLDGLAPGAYKLQFNDRGNVYVDEWYNDKANLAAAIPVVVTSGAVTSSINAQLAVAVPPTISSLTPTSGPSVGGTQVTITGTGFHPEATASFRGSPCTVSGVTTPTSLTCTTTGWSVGVVDVVVTNPDTLSATKADGFTFLTVVPGVPGKPTAVAGDAKATVKVVAGVGLAPTSFQVWANPGGGFCQVIVPATSCVIDGLVNGVPYTFTAEAVRGSWLSDPSVASNAVTPTAAQAAPREPDQPVATPGDSKVAVHVVGDPDFGGTPTSFKVKAKPGGATCTVIVPATSCVVRGLTNGTPYRFTATATNSIGTSSESDPSDSVVPSGQQIPVATSPSRPSQVRAVVKKRGKVEIFFSVANDGGAPILSSTARCTAMKKKGPTRTAVKSGTGRVLVKKLKKRSVYKCKVQATNSVGASPWSSRIKVRAR